MRNVDELWFANLDSIGTNGFDIAVYLTDKISVWPCGNMVDDDQDKFCPCEICKSVRKILEENDAYPPGLLDIPLEQHIKLLEIIRTKRSSASASGEKPGFHSGSLPPSQP